MPPKKPLRKSLKSRGAVSGKAARAKPRVRKIHAARLALTKTKVPVLAPPAATDRVWLVGDDLQQRNSAAQEMAKRLSLALQPVDLNQIVSRYIGETEKNLNLLFARAADLRTLLFFDEADALFGKRSEIKDAHDRFANVSVAYLLERLEQATVPILIATNGKPRLSPATLEKVARFIELPRKAPRAQFRRKRQ